MARLQDVLAKVQIKDEHGQWKDLKEFDTDYSRKEESNSARHWTTNIVVREGPFRLMISLTEHFDWKQYNALLLKLTCQEGFWINEYPVLALKTASSIQDEYGTLGCMAENLETKQLEYSLESVYLPLIPPATDTGFAMTTFSFKKVEGRLIDRNCAMREKPSISMHKISLDVDRCVVMQKSSFKETRLKTNYNMKLRDRSRAALFPEIDIETQGKVDVYNMLKKTPEDEERLGGPGYSAEKTKLTFNFVYHSKVPGDAISPENIDIIDTTTTVQSRKSVSDRLLRLSSDTSTPTSCSRIIPFRSDLFDEPTKLYGEDDARNLTCPQSVYEEKGYASTNEEEYDDYDSKRVCTPPWSPLDRTQPVSAIPIFAPTSVPASNRGSAPDSALTSPPKTPPKLSAVTTPPSAPFPAPARATEPTTFANYPPASSTAVSSVLQALKDIERNFESIEATRHEVLVRCRNKEQSVRSEIDGNEEAIKTDQAKIEDYEAQVLRLNKTIGALNLDVGEKKSKNRSLNEKYEALKDEIETLEAQGIKNQNKLDAFLKKTNDSFTELNAELDEQVRQSSSSSIKRRRSQASLDNSPCNDGRRIRRTSSVMMDVDSN